MILLGGVSIYRQFKLQFVGVIPEGFVVSLLRISPGEVCDAEKRSESKRLFRNGCDRYYAKTVPK